MNTSTSTMEKDLYKKSSSNEVIPAVVAWLDNNVGLELSRILSKHGIPVIALAVDVKNYRCKTRFVQRIVAVPSGDKGLLQALDELSHSLPGGAVFCPTTDALAFVASKNRVRLEQTYRMAIANEDTLEMLGDKAQVSKLVKKVGISLPQTWTVSAVEEIQPLIDACTLPLIVKPSVRTDAWWTTIREKAFRIDTRAELENALQKCVGLAPSIIVQEWIEGDDSNMFFYHSYIGRDRQCLAELVGQKLRQWPRITGVGASSVQVDVPKLNQISRKLLDSTDFHGFCEIEYKRREGTDDYYFIEANVGRPSLHAALAESCGIEMQHTMYCDCTDMPLPEANEVKYSRAKSVVWRFELQAVARAWLDKELTLYGWIKSLAGRSRSLDLHLDDPAVVWAGFLQPAFEFSFKKMMSVIRGVSSSSGKTR